MSKPGYEAVSDPAKEAIAALRKRIASNKGKAARRAEKIRHLRYDIEDAQRAIRNDQAAIRDLGGKVKS